MYDLKSMVARILVGLGLSEAGKRAIKLELKHLQLSYYNSSASISNI